MSWLSNHQLIRKVLLNGDDATRAAFDGVYPLDQLPRAVPHYPFLMFVNTQSHNLPGLHWIVVFIDAAKVGDVFDSFALPLSNTLIQWLNRHTRRWGQSHLTLQHPLSSTCGAFALYYALHRLKEKNVTFHKTFHDNEKLVLDFFKSLK